MPDRSAGDTPLVSVIVRSTGRPVARRRRSRRSRRRTIRAIEVVRRRGVRRRRIRRSRSAAGRIRCGSCAAPRGCDRPEAANAGLDAATGDWITFLDDDDVFLPDHVSRADGGAARTRRTRASSTASRARRARRRPRRTRSASRTASVQLLRRATSSTCRRARVRALAAGAAAAASTQRCSAHRRLGLLPAARRSSRRSISCRARPSTGTRTPAAPAPAAASTRTTTTSPQYRDRVLRQVGAPPRCADRPRRAAAALRGGGGASSGDFAAAEARCREVLAISPNDPWALNLLASIERATGPSARSRGGRSSSPSPCARTIPTLTFNLALLVPRAGRARARQALLRPRAGARRGFCAASRANSTRANLPRLHAPASDRPSLRTVHHAQTQRLLCPIRRRDRRHQRQRRRRHRDRAPAQGPDRQGLRRPQRHHRRADRGPDRHQPRARARDRRAEAHAGRRVRLVPLQAEGARGESRAVRAADRGVPRARHRLLLLQRRQRFGRHLPQGVAARRSSSAIR